MTEIVNTASPQLVIKKTISAEISCPNCSNVMRLDPSKVDIGNIVKCESCEKMTYYPFERPWYRRKKLVIGYIASMLVTFILGLLTNYISARIDPARTQNTIRKPDTTIVKEK